jgi:hypothetical protein
MGTATGQTAAAERIAQISLLSPHRQGAPASVNPAAPQRGVVRGKLSGPGGEPQKA